MNNKGFAVSSVLYAILISFLLFLGVALAMFSSANNITLSANDDIVNGTGFSVKRVAETIEEESVCDSNGKWILASDRLIKINSRYGVIYWPHDFKITETGNEVCYDDKICAESSSGLASMNYNAIHSIYGDSQSSPDFNEKKASITFKDKISVEEKTIEFYNVCR